MPSCSAHRDRDLIANGIVGGKYLAFFAPEYMPRTFVQGPPHVAPDEATCEATLAASSLPNATVLLPERDAPDTYSVSLDEFLALHVRIGTATNSVN